MVTPHVILNVITIIIIYTLEFTMEAYARKKQMFLQEFKVTQLICKW